MLPAWNDQGNLSVGVPLATEDESFRPRGIAGREPRKQSGDILNAGTICAFARGHEVPALQSCAG